MEIDDLTELQNYLRNKFNIDVYVNNSTKKNFIKNINDVYFKLFLCIFFILLIIYCIYFYKKYYILFILLFILCIYFLQRYIIMIYLYDKYYKNNHDHDHNHVKLNNIKFQTGDILQEVSNWNYIYGFLIYFSNLDFFHNLIVIKFKNKDYFLNYTGGNFGYPGNILSFKSPYIEIFPLDSYFMDNYHATKYYRLFQINKPINNDKIFKFLQTLNYEKLGFTFLPCIKENVNNNNYNCMSFILTLLIFLNIIPSINVNNFSSIDLIYLPGLSNKMYNEPIIIKI